MQREVIHAGFEFLTPVIMKSYTGCGKLASFFHIALSAKREVSLPHPVSCSLQDRGISRAGSQREAGWQAGPLCDSRLAPLLHVAFRFQVYCWDHTQFLYPWRQIKKYCFKPATITSFDVSYIRLSTLSYHSPKCNSRN
jgi:hypothetical protein